MSVCSSSESCVCSDIGFFLARSVAVAVLSKITTLVLGVQSAVMLVVLYSLAIDYTLCCLLSFEIVY